MASSDQVSVSLFLKVSDAVAAAKNFFGSLVSGGSESKAAFETVTLEVDKAGKSLSMLEKELAALRTAQKGAFSPEEAAKYAAQIKGVESEINKFTSEVERLGKELQEDEHKASGFFGGLKAKAHEAGESFEGIAGKLGNLGGALGGGLIGGAAFSAISSGISEIMEKAKELDDAQDGLTIALSRTTLSAEDQKKEFDALSEKAEEVGNAFAIPKTEVMKLQATVTGFSGITGKKLDELTELSIGASQALGMPAEAVARMIAKAADPEQEAALKRLGITFEKNATTAEKMAIVQAKLGPSIAAAKAAADDGIGGFERLKETVEDAVINTAGSIVEGLKPIFDILSAILGPILKVGSAILKLAFEFNPLTLIMKAFHAVASLLAPVWDKIKETFEKLKPTFATVGHLFSELWGSVKGIGEALFSAVKHLFGFGEGAKSSSGFMEKLGQAIEFVAKIIETTVRGIQGTVNVVKLIVDTISSALQNFDILHPGKMLEAFDGFGEKAKAAFNSGFARTDVETPEARPEGAEQGKEKTPKEKSGTTRTLLQDVQDYIKQQKALEDADHQTIEQTAKNFEVRRAQLQKERETKEAHIAATIKDAKKRNDALAKLDAEQIEAEAALKDAAEQERAKEADLRNKAGLEEAESVDGRLSAVRKKYEDQNKALKVLLDKKAIDQKEYDSALLNHARLAEEEKLQVRIDGIEKDAKIEEDKQKKNLDATLKNAKLTAAILGKSFPTVSEYTLQISAWQNYTDERAKASRLLEEKELAAALATMSAGEARDQKIADIKKAFANQRVADESAANDAIEKIHEAQIANDKEIALLKAGLAANSRNETKDDLQYKLDALDIEFEANKRLIEEKYKGQAEYQDRIDALTEEHGQARDKMVLEHVQKENLMYKASATLIASVFKQLTDGLKSQLAKWLGYEEKEKKKESDADLKLKEINYKKSLQKLEEDSRNSVISYEEYLAKKQKLTEEYNGKDTDSQQEQLTAWQSMKKTLGDSMVELAGQTTEAFINSEIAKLIAGQATATGGLIASIMETLPFPANILAIGGGVAAMVGLYSGLIGKANSSKSQIKGAAKGLVHKPERDGSHGQTIKIGEEGKEEFAAPTETFLQYARTELTPAVVRSFTAAERQRLIGIPRVNPVLNPIASQRMQGGLSPQHVQALDSFTRMLDQVSKEGFKHEFGEVKFSNGSLRTAVKQGEKNIQNRARTLGGGIG